MPCALITGISGQDGSFLAELLIGKGYIVYGVVRRSSNMTNLDRLKPIRHHPNLRISYGDITDFSSIMRILQTAYDMRGDKPLEVYNLAAQSHVRVSFDTPLYTAQSDAIGALNILEAIVGLPEFSPNAVRFYQASTSELYGCTPGPQNEETPMKPQSPYGVAKLYAYWMVNNYRNIYKGHFVNGILFNHESERRAENFVTRKITQYVARYSAKKHGDEPLRMGNLYSKRDWGYAPDFVQAMYLMLQHDKAEDFVIATAECHNVKEFIEESFNIIGVKIRWEGSGLEEKGINISNEEVIVTIDPQYFRPTEVDYLLGDTSKAHKILAWKPKHTFRDLVRIMTLHDIDKFRGDR